MTEIPNTGCDAGSDSLSENPALTGGVFRSGSDPHEMIAALIDGEGKSEAMEANSPSPRAWGFDVEEINRSYALAIWGGRDVVINEQSSGPIPERVRFMSVGSLKSWFANRLTETIGPDGKVRSVSWAAAWHSHRDRRQYDGIEFFPNPDGAVGTPNYFNLWHGFGVTASPAGSYNVFRDHLFTNVCGGDQKLFNYVFGWMAHIVQRPRERLGTSIVLYGKRGTGKSKVGEVLGSLFPSHYCQVDDARYVTGQFNVHMSRCLLLQADEAVWAGDPAAAGRLKGLITSKTQMIEAKNVDPIQLDNFLRVIMTSNESWVVPAGMDERRFCVLEVGNGCAQDHDYFGEMDDELNAGGRERLLHDLLAFDLSQVDLWQIPKTHGLLQQKIRSFDTIEDFWFNRLQDGSDWPADVVCSDLYAEYIKASTQIGIGRKRTDSEFGSRLFRLVPGLRKHRPTRETEPGVMRRVWCYQMPSLDECRAAFDELLGQSVDWPALSPGEGERAKYEEPPDEFIPV